MVKYSDEELSKLIQENIIKKIAILSSKIREKGPYKKSFLLKFRNQVTQKFV